MKILIRLFILVVIVGGIGAAAYSPLQQYLQQRNQPEFKFAEVSRGTIRSVVNATGEVKPVLSVAIGSFVSGPIIELSVDFNTQVKKGDLLARIDPRIYRASVSSDRASLSTRLAEVNRVKATLQQAINDEKRALTLFFEDQDYISDAELDRLKFSRLSQEAQLVLAEAAVEQSRAQLDNSVANLEYTEIRAPTDGIVIDRKIDPGQTLAAQFQTPELFIIAPDMEKEMHVYASIDEADIGLIREAKKGNKPVEFRVDAYPDELFIGKISQVRLSSTELQNVVTYPVVVSTENQELKLLPGMTANLTFLIEEKHDALRVPRAAIRFYPQKPELVHPDDRDILDGSDQKNRESDVSNEAQIDSMSAQEQIEETKKKNRRHVWIAENNKLRAVEIETGLYENKYVEVIAGDLKDGQQVVTGIKTK